MFKTEKLAGTAEYLRLFSEADMNSFNEATKEEFLKVISKHRELLEKQSHINMDFETSDENDWEDAFWLEVEMEDNLHGFYCKYC